MPRSPGPRATIFDDNGNLLVGQTTMSASLPVVIASDQTTLTVAGDKTNNAAAPGATNIGAFTAVATAAAPSYTEGNQVALSTDLAGTIRTSNLSVGLTSSAVPTSATFIGASDGTNLVGLRLKPASVSAIATDPALVVTISPNIGVTGRLPVSLAESEDAFSQLVIAQRLPQVQISFNTVAPVNLLTVTTTGTGTTALGTGVGQFSTGAGVTSDVKGVSFAGATYSPHHEIYAGLTASFTTPTSAASFQRLGLYDTNNGFSFGYNGLTFGLWLRFNGADTFVPQASWNLDTCLGGATSKFTRAGTPEALNPTKINFFRVRFGWLGIAPVEFEMLSPDGNFVVVHMARFPNLQAVPSVVTPNLPLTVHVSKTGSDATNLVVLSSCWVAGSSSSTTPSMQGIGQISALNGVQAISTVGTGALSFAITGTWVGTLTFQFSIDGNNWVRDLAYSESSGLFAYTTTANINCSTATGGYKYYRIIATAWTSGTATIAFSTGPVPNVVTSQSLLFDANGNGITNANPLPVQQVVASTASVGLVSGVIALGGGSVGTINAIRATTYTEPTTNAQRSMSSANVNDTSAGTGARTVRITYFTSTGSGPFTETVTLNGTTAVNTVSSTICFIEKMEVVTVGSTGANAGVITLFASTAGAGGTVGTIGVGSIVAALGDRQTLWAHHYVALGKTASLATFVVGSSTSNANLANFFMRSKDPTVAAAEELQISDFLPAAGSVVRALGIPLKVTGPARITAYGVPTANSTTLVASFDYSEV